VALGASDYVLKGASRQELISTITGAAQGKSPSNKGELSRVAGAMSKTPATGSKEDIPLTNRETQVLRHVALGLSNKEIGRSLSISIETVKEHVQNILRKIVVTDRNHPLRGQGSVRARVSAFVGCTQAGGADVRIDLRRHQAFVP
jgi:DNA-binding NarL/FixJ family response regulator